MKFPVKNIYFITAILVLAAVYIGCTKGPDIKSYTYPAPAPGGMSPNIGLAGYADVTITGAQFGDYKQAVKVFFGGIKADSIISCVDDKIVVRVPATALSGKVSLQVWTNTVDSIGSFNVVPYPVITSAEPLTGLPGDVVTIHGAGFGDDASNVKVKFNGAEATVNSIKDTIITTTVPVGASSGDITVTVGNYKITGPGYSMLVSVPAAIYQLDFEDNLLDKISGVAATYTQGDAAPIGYADGISGRAVSLAGYANPTANRINQAIQIPTSIVKQQEFTVAMWVNWATGRTGADPLFEIAESRTTRITFLARMSGNWNGSNGKMVARYLLANKVPVSAPATYEDYLIGNGVLPSNKWVHVAFTFSYANTNMKLYIDGQEFGTKTFTRTDVDPFLMNISRAFLGAPTNNSANEPSFAGMFDKFQIFNSVLSRDQIYTLYYKK
jgi:hypothetical protein